MITKHPSKWFLQLPEYKIDLERDVKTNISLQTPFHKFT